MRIAVSTIAKNESKNVKDFVASCKEADLVSVLDTGSTDGTQKLLKKYGALAGEAKFNPFRFDAARNKALDLLPKDIDIVVSIDMDERLLPGWRAALESVWRPDVDAVSYWYIGEWQDEAKTIPATPTWRTKIFKRKGTKWFRPVHEVPLLADGTYPRTGVLCREIEVHHYQKGERNYEPLLTQLLAKDPNDEDAYIQRGAEWLKLNEYKKAIDDYERYLLLTAGQTSSNPQSDRSQLVAGRRAYTHISIAQAKHALGYAPQTLVDHFLKAVGECSSLREAWTYLADGMFSIGNYPAAYGAAMTALSITNNGIHPMDMRCWGDFPKTLADNAFTKILSGASVQNVQQSFISQNAPVVSGRNGKNKKKK
jgi:tetratricopeptide (TPR) repeat protein